MANHFGLKIGVEGEKEFFATCNGDPIFLNSGYVYTTSHGVNNPEWELLAKDIESYFSTFFLNKIEFEDAIWNSSENDL